MLTQLLPTIYAIRVPVEAHSFWKDDGNIMWYKDRLNNVLKSNITLLNKSILGCCTTTEVDFDCSGIVETEQVHKGIMYKCYSGKYAATTSAAESLRSLLNTSCGT